MYFDTGFCRCKDISLKYENLQGQVRFLFIFNLELIEFTSDVTSLLNEIGKFDQKFEKDFSLLLLLYQFLIFIHWGFHL